MNCTICGKSTLPGAMLCAPCKAALKRARYITVQEDIRRPSVIDVRRQARRARPAAAAAEIAPVAPADAEIPVPIVTDAAANARLARRIFGGVFLLAAVLGGASYFGLRDLGARSHDDASSSQASASAAPVADATSVSQSVQAAPPAVAPPSAPSVASAVPSADAAVTPPASDASAHTVSAAPNLPASKLTASNAGRRAMAKNSTSFATTNGDPPDAVPMPEPEKPQPVVAPPPPPAPDRWQSLRDAIAQCDREGLFDGIICGQKARIQYCAGYWGKVPQCPGPTVNPDR